MERDLACIAFVAEIPILFGAAPHAPFKTVAELIAYARANPGKVNMASAGVGSTSHLAGVILTQMGGVEALHVPHKGIPPAVLDVISGRLSSIFASYSDVARLDYAERVVAAYLQRYAPRALARGDWQTLARVHNGGPAGARNPATRAYWKRVERHLCHKPK